MLQLPRPFTVSLLVLLLMGSPMTDRDPRAKEPDQSVRTPEVVRRDGNHLKNESSLYLQQHAHNPIDWYPWGEAALAKARAEDKPIFLSIGYSSCHWCHVMEHEVFEHDDVAAFMNEHFVSIKVDREERPDLDAVYMDAVQLMTGRGGWPMSVFLTPDLKPFHGGTYFPHDRFMQLVQQVASAFETRRDELEAQGHKVSAEITRDALASLPAENPVDAALIEQAVIKGKAAYDPVNQGFQQRQKFPTPVKWRFLLHEYRRTGDEDLAEMITGTLDAMQGGGIYDHVGGGFHRYTVDSDWTVPHFEKMLYDNGQLAGLFLEAGVVFGRDDYTATGRDVLDFLIREMRDANGGFFSSYDADSGGEEGTYYIWDIADITAAVGDEDGPVLAALLGVSEQGNFEHTGKSVLTRRADMIRVSARFERDRVELDGLLPKHRQALRTVRDGRVPPGLDRKIITAWNGLVISSLAQAYAVTGEAGYLDSARTAADFLLTRHRRDDGSLRRASSDGRTSGEGIIDDYAFLADGLLEIYQFSGEEKYLQAARELIDFANAHFGRPEGGYYQARDTADNPLGRSVDYFDSVIPSGNAAMLNAMLKIAAITGESSYRQTAKTSLENWTGLLDRAGLEMAWWFDAAVKLVGPYYDVVIAGDPAAAETAALRAALFTRLPAGAVVSLVPAGGAGLSLVALAPALEGKSAFGGTPTAFVCEFGTCQAPTGDPAVMKKQMMVGWTK